MDDASRSDSSTEAQILVKISTQAQRYAGKLMGSQAAEDLAHDLVLECLQRMRAGKWRIDVSLAAFVRSMVRRKRTDLVRLSRDRASRLEAYRREIADSTHVWMSPDLSFEEQEIESFHGETLARLPATWRRAYVMVREEDASYQNTAARLGLSRATVCKHVVAAQKRFRNELLERGIATPPRARVRANDSPRRA